MAPKNRIIIDTDPGVDDILALLLAFSASSDDLEVALVSVTYGNVPVNSCLKNVVALFRVIDAEINWRKARGMPIGFSSLLASKPVVARGAEHPLEEEILAADHFHGADGLHGVHEGVPHLAPDETWQEAFHNADNTSALYSTTNTPAHREILRLLRENPPGTITIAVLGPMTNVALAASEDLETFLKVKELVVIGGAVDVPSNITPVAEFNTYADATAAARVYALTSLSPQFTLPLSSLQDHKPRALRKLELKLFPLDLTSPHRLSRVQLEQRSRELVEANSPLAHWMAHFMSRTFDKINSLKPVGSNSEPSLQLHDPLVLWYVLTSENIAWRSSSMGEDLRVEPSGQWSRGMLISDRRWMKRPFDQADDELVVDELPGDTNGWLTPGRGNRVTRMVKSPGENLFAKVLLNSIFPYSYF